MVTRYGGRPPGGPNPRPGGGLLILVAVVLGLLALLWWWIERPVERPGPEQYRERPPRTRPRDPVPEPMPPRDPVEEKPVPEAPEPVGTLALVIDDLGRSIDELRDLEALGIPISWSVLPFEPRTGDVVAWLSQGDHEVLCHLPMEASNGANPGPGALTSAMSPSDLAAATREALARVPIAVGVNNHMGSQVTSDATAMAAILGVVREQGLFFVDSRTSADTVAYETARAMGIPAAERQIFLDADASAEGVREQFARWRQVARERGAAVAIAHPRPHTLEVLREEVPKAKEEGFVFVPVSFVLDRTGRIE